MKKKILGSGFQRHKQCVPPSVLQTCTLLHSHWHLDVCHPMGSTCIWPSTILVSIMTLEADFAPRSLCPLCSFRRSKSKEQDGLWGGSSSTERLAHGIWLRTLSPAVQGVTSQKQVLPAQRLHRPNQALPALPDWWREYRREITLALLSSSLCISHSHSKIFSPPWHYGWTFSVCASARARSYRITGALVSGMTTTS